jgi:hypothetical protein
MGLAAVALVASCSPGDPARDTSKQRGAWDVEVTSVGDPYTFPGAEPEAGRRTVLVRFTATNVSARPQTFTTATTLGLADTDGGWFEQVTAEPWAGVTDADRADVPVGASTTGGVLFRVREHVPAAKLRLVVGREMAIRPVGGLPPTAYTVALPVGTPS